MITFININISVRRKGKEVSDLRRPSRTERDCFSCWMAHLSVAPGFSSKHVIQVFCVAMAGQALRVISWIFCLCTCVFGVIFCFVT